jgi:hypothetical protein
MGLVKKHLSAKGNESFNCASLMGGGCLSVIFRRVMATILEQGLYNIRIGTTTACISPCSHGALLQRYFREDELPAFANFYIARTEEYHAPIHKGETTTSSEYQSGKKVVHERLQRIMRCENGEFSGEDKVPMVFLVHAKSNVRIHVDLYYSEEDFEDHSALRGADGNLRPGVRSYPLAYIDLDDLAGHDFKEKTGGKNGKPHYELKAFVQMVGSSEKLELKVYLMKATFQYYRGFSDRNVLSTEVIEVWNKSSSHFVRSTTGI